jgi:hypothetical protein
LATAERATFAEAVAKFKLEFIQEVLARHRGNRSESAAEMGVHRNTVTRILLAAGMRKTLRRNISGSVLRDAGGEDGRVAIIDTPKIPKDQHVGSYVTEAQAKKALEARVEVLFKAAKGRSK